MSKEWPKEVHICNGEKIRTYPAMVCSLCRPGSHPLTLLMTNSQVEEYNEKLKKDFTSLGELEDK